VKADIRRAAMEDINGIFDDLKQGRIEGRVVLDMAMSASAKQAGAEQVDAR
jgi:propanol-preferring alcohol dehydrogenase